MLEPESGYRRKGTPMNRRGLLKTLAAGLAAPPIAATARNPGRQLPVLRTRIAGFHYHQGPALEHRLRQGQPLDLVREPANPHDTNAVRIDWRGQTLGYLPRHHNHAPARLMDQGEALQTEIAALDFTEEPWRPVEVDVLLDLQADQGQ